MKKIKYKKFTAKLPPAGFTLMEMLVSIFIIALISGISLYNYRAADRSSNLTLATHQLAGDIRLAQNNTLGLAEMNGAFPLGGWGVYFNTAAPDHYIIFGDDGNYQYDDPVNEKYLEVNLPNDIIISQLTVDGTPDNEVTVIFEPPDPLTYLRDSSGDLDNKTFSLKLKETVNNTDKTILINSWGLIDVD